ncbi:Alpha/Beta hydrolase protein [Nemania serpens]|nr:Alpha/Beta hydrolase protein [Nemania serpens]
MKELLLGGDDALEQLGPPGTALSMTSDGTETHTYAVAEKLGCSQDDDKDSLDCLREVPVDKLTETAMAYSVENHPPAGLFTFIPSVDGDFLPERQFTLYKAGKFVKGIPMVFGWVQDDGATNAGPRLRSILFYSIWSCNRIE